MEFDDKYKDDLNSVHVEKEMNKNDKNLKFDEKSNNHSDLGIIEKDKKKVIEINKISISKEKVYNCSKLYYNIKIEDHLV